MAMRGGMRQGVLQIINIKNDVFSFVAQRVRERHQGVFVTGAYTATPARFPAHTITQIDNRVATRYRTTKIENAAIVAFETQTYSNKASGKEAEAESIAATSDEAFEEIGFTRTMYSVVPNLNDATIYRIVCRYEAIVDKDLWIYQS